MVYQEFEQDIYSALVELNPILIKYQTIKLLFGKNNYQPTEIKKGFMHFCGEYAYDFEIIDDMTKREIEGRTAYINLKEDDLVTLIKKIKNTNLKLGKDVGIISYNDSIIKEILLEGITVISTDFQQLGKKAGQVILERKRQQYDNPFYVIHRKSL